MNNALKTTETVSVGGVVKPYSHMMYANKYRHILVRVGESIYSSASFSSPGIHAVT